MWNKKAACGAGVISGTALNMGNDAENSASSGKMISHALKLQYLRRFFIIVLKIAPQPHFVKQKFDHLGAAMTKAGKPGICHAESRAFIRGALGFSAGKETGTKFSLIKETTSGAFRVERSISLQFLHHEAPNFINSGLLAVRAVSAARSRAVNGSLIAVVPGSSGWFFKSFHPSEK